MGRNECRISCRCIINSIGNTGPRGIAGRVFLNLLLWAAAFPQAIRGGGLKLLPFRRIMSAQQIDYSSLRGPARETIRPHWIAAVTGVRSAGVCPEHQLP